MKYRLGLDLGTNSIGWCALKLDGEGKPNGVLASGVRLLTPNQEAGRDPQSKVSLAADRRAARSMRRRRDRFLRRQKRLMELLVESGLMPDAETARKELEKIDPYMLRARALDGRIEAHELGRALFHINQRRGFKSNRIADSDDDEKGATKQGIKALREALAAEGCRTLGQFLAKRHEKREQVRFRPTTEGTKILYDFYPSRDLVEHEIDEIWKAQKAYHSQLTDELLARLKHIAIEQRRLKKPVVGRCTFRPEEERAPRALPDFQRFRILQDLSNLVVERPGAASRKISITERDALAALLGAQASPVTFEKMRKAIKLKDEERFNYEATNRKGFDPDLTAAKLGAKSAFGKTWRSLERARQNEIVEKLLTEEDEDALAEWLEADAGLAPENTEYVAGKLRLPQGYGNLGRTMLADIIDAMTHESVEATDPATGEVYPAPITYDQAVERLGLHHSSLREGEKLARLPYYGDLLKRHVIERPDAPEGSQERRGKVTNPTVHIALNQTGKLVNALIDEFGAPEQIVVELARELKQNQKQKDDHNKRIRENTEANEQRAKKLKELEVENNGENRLRMRLYAELPADERVCVYSGKPIGIEKLYSAEIEIDHILPFSATLDDGIANKVLCTRESNREKGNRAPADAFGATRLTEMAERAERLFKNKAWRFAPDAMARFAENGGWSARHLTDTQHIARLTKAYLEHVCEPGQVWAVPGRMTAMLRGLWGLPQLLPGHNLPGGKKDRGDHRHHAIDAFVVACTERSLLQRIANAAGKGEALDMQRLFGSEGVPKPWDGFRDELCASLNALVVAHKRDHGIQGQLHEETAYGIVDAEIDGKKFNLVTRKPIDRLTAKEITQVQSASLRAELKRVAEAAEATGTKLNLALAEWGRANGVRRVRVLKTEQSFITVRHGPDKQFEKALVPGDNHRIEIFEHDGKWLCEAVTVFDANKRGWTPEWTRRYPGARLVMTLHKGDMIEADLGTGDRYWTVYRLNAASNRVWVAPHQDAHGQDERAWQRPTMTTLQKAGAKLAQLDMLGRPRAPGGG